MKHAFTYKSGKLWYVKDVPKEIDHACENLPNHVCPMCDGYKQALQKAIDEAIEVENWRDLWQMITDKYTPEGECSFFCKDGEIYYLDNVEVEIKPFSCIVKPATETKEETIPEPPDFEDRATNYFHDEPSVKAGIQLQKDIWNEFVVPLSIAKEHFSDGVDKAIETIKRLKSNETKEET